MMTEKDKTLEYLEKFSDFDVSQIKCKDMSELANQILGTASGSFIEHYKVKQTLLERLVRFECCCPYCKNELYRVTLMGKKDGSGIEEALIPDNIYGDYLYSENHPQEMSANGLPIKRRNNFVKDSLRYSYKINSINIDHIIPRTRGGSDVFHNLLIVCETCNKSKNNLTAEEFGYPEIQVLSEDSPQIPMFTRRGEREFAVIYLPIEVYEKFRSVHGDVSAFIHDEIKKGK